MLIKDVWTLEIPDPTEKYVLLALADSSNEDGTCFPSVSKISQKTGLDERTIQRRMSSLKAKGFITVEYRYGRSSIYRISITPTPVCVSPPSISHHRHTDTPPPSNGHHTPVTQTPITYKEPIIEPIITESHEKRFKVPTIEEVKLGCAKVGLTDEDGEEFWHYWNNHDWRFNHGKGARMKSLGSALATWKINKFKYGNKNNGSNHRNFGVAKGKTDFRKAAQATMARQVALPINEE